MTSVVNQDHVAQSNEELEELKRELATVRDRLNKQPSLDELREMFTKLANLDAETLEKLPGRVDQLEADAESVTALTNRVQVLETIPDSLTSLTTRIDKLENPEKPKTAAEIAAEEISQYRKEMKAKNSEAVAAAIKKQDPAVVWEIYSLLKPKDPGDKDIFQLMITSVRDIKLLTRLVSLS